MKLLQSLNDSFLIKALNGFFESTQKASSALIENGFLIKNIDNLINIFAFATLFFSTFLDSEKLGITMIAAFGFLTLKYLLKAGSKITIDIFDLLVVVYVLIFCVAAFTSSWFLDSLHGLIKTITYFFSYLVFKDSIKTKPTYRVLYIALIAFLSSSEAFIGIYQQLFKVDSLATWQDLSNMNPEQIMTRVFGTLQPLNPNLLAGYLIATMPAILGCTFYDFKKKQFNIIAAIGLLTTLLTIVFTGCRGAYIAITAQMATFIAISGHIIWHDFSEKQYLRKIWSGTILFGITSVLLLILSQEALRTRVCSIFAQREDSSTAFRMNVYQSSFKMFLDNFFCGIGVGNWTFREVYGLYMRTGFDALGAYCVPLEIAVETGILGLINFIGFIGTSIFLAIKKIGEKIPYNEKIIMSVTLISLIGMMIHGMVDTVWFRPQIQFVFWLIIAILSQTNTLTNEVK